MDMIAQTVSSTKCSRRPRKPMLDRLCTAEKQRLKERYGVYGDNDAITRYVRSLPIAKANPDIRIHVTKKWKEVNAAAFPDGTVFVTDTLIGSSDYREEVEFAIQHEIKHIRSKDSEKRLRTLDENGMLGLIGVSRINEYQADLTDMLRDKETSVNPYGGVLLLRKMAKKEKRSDLEHGGTYTRLLNLEYAIQLVDMEALSTEMQEIPKEVKACSCRQADPWDAIVENAGEKYEQAVSAAKKTKFHGAMYALRRVPDAFENKELQNVLEEKINKEIRKQFPNASEAGVKAFRNLLYLSFGHHGDNAKAVTALYNSPVLTTELVDMIENCPGTFSPYVDLDSHKEVARLIERRLKDEEPEKAYAIGKRALAVLEKEFPEFIFERTVLATKLSEAYDKKHMEEFLERLEMEGFEVDRQLLYGNICERFDLSTEEADELGEHEFFRGEEGVGTKAQMSAKKVSNLRIDYRSFFEFRGFKEEKRAELEATAQTIVDIIDPKDLDEFLDFLEAYQSRGGYTVERYQRHQKAARTLGERETQVAMEVLLDNHPHVFLEKLYARLGQKACSNAQIIKFLKNRGSWVQTGLLLTLGTHKRKFSREELQELKFLSREHWAYALFGTLKRVDRKEAFEILKLAIEFEMPEFGGIGERMHLEHVEMEALGYSKIALHDFRKYEFDKDNREHMDQLITASAIIPDPNLKLRVQKTAVKRYLGMLDRKEAYELLFNDRRLADYSVVDEREEYVDKEISEPAELERITDDLVRRVEEIDGMLAGAEILKAGLLDAMLLDKERLLKALLLTAENDRELRKCIAEAALKCHICEKDRGSDYALEFEQRIDTGEILRAGTFEEQEERIYKLDKKARYLLCHELLVGKGGVLLTQGRRRRALEWFFDNFIEQPKTPHEEKVHSFLRKAFVAVAKKAEVSTLYFLVQPLIAERILGLPKKRTPWETAMRLAKTSALRKLCKTEEDWFYYGEELEEAMYGAERLIFGRKEVFPEEVYHEGKEENFELQLERECSKYVEAPEVFSGKLTPVEFVKHLASKLGAPGVRFLQSLGLYAELPPELRSEFDEVYDRVKGQSKLSAHHTLQKTWTDGELQSLGQRIGGGSLATVYEAQVDNRECVVKVVNPNVLYRAETICDNLREVLGSDESLARGLPLLENIRTWVRKDVSLAVPDGVETFLQNDGFAVEGNDYTIRVPENLGRGKRHVTEEMVHGLNLTQWEELEKKHDMKQVVSLLVKNTVHQMSSGVVHADMHVGNIRVNEDKSITWLDNNLLLALSENDQEFLGSLVLLQGDKGALAKEISTYLCGFEENNGVNRERLQEGLETRFAGNGYQDVGALVADITAIITENEGTVPLNVMLLTKNALSMERLAKRAGFSNIMEAYLA